MQRKMKLIRKLLEYVEMSPTEDPLPVPEIDGYDEAQVHYHIGLCEEAGYLVTRKPASDGPGRRFTGIDRMTWKGHEALDGLRNRQQCA